MTNGKLFPITFEFDAQTSILTLELAKLAFEIILLRLLLLLKETSGCELAFGFLALLFENLKISIYFDESGDPRTLFNANAEYCGSLPRVGNSRGSKIRTKQ